jgi:phosphatidylglycerol:prolipoprotein diacylglycerol transferase
MHPILLQLGRFKVYSWGFMLALAAIVGIYGVERNFEKQGYDRDIVLDMVVLMVLFGILGARISYIIIYDWQAFITDPLMFFSPGFSGLIWYGGLLGGFIAFVVYIWRKNLPFWEMADLFAPYLALGYALVRIGCFLNGCCYGLPTDSAWGVIFPAVDDLHRHPTQLYSSLINFLLFGFLIWLWPRRQFNGQIFLAYLVGYTIYRFVIEFFRFSLINWGPFTIGHVYTAVLFLIAVVIYVYRRYREGDAIYITKHRHR